MLLINPENPKQRVGGLTQMSVMVCFRRKLPLDFARGQLAGTPLCMEQYYRLFTSYRYPGLKTDTLKVDLNAASSVPEHMIVACKNQVS